MADAIETVMADFIVMIVSFLDLGRIADAILSMDFGIFGTGNNAFLENASLSVPSLMTLVKPIGYSICALFFLLGLIDLGMSDRLTLESFMKDFGKLAAGVFFVSISTEFVKLGMGMGAWLSSVLKPDLSGDPFSLMEDALKTSLLGKNSSLLGLILGGCLVLIILLLIGLLMAIACMFICFTRVFELAIRAIFMPIALALMCDDGWRGSAGRYIKKFVALCSQGAVIALVARLYTNMSVWLFVDASSSKLDSSKLLGIIGGKTLGFFGSILSVFPVLALGIAAIAMMFKSQGIINDVFGA